jgi:hypothetical protein
MMELIDRRRSANTARSEAARAIPADRLSPCAAARRCWSGSSRPVRCGGATWAAPLAQYHDWIVETAQQLARGSGRDLAISLQG